jgi:very-short-patch-repair endonuclease
MKIHRARELRRSSTWAERLMWRWLRDRRFSGYKFRRQHPVGPYFLDFFCEEAKLAIELDGSRHGTPDRKDHDAAREAYISLLGIKTLRIWNSRLLREKEVVRNTIWEGLQERAPHPLPEYTRPNPPLTLALSLQGEGTDGRGAGIGEVQMMDF